MRKIHNIILTVTPYICIYVLGCVVLLLTRQTQAGQQPKASECIPDCEDVYTPAIDPATGADSLLIERLNVCTEESDRLKDYILVLEEDVNLLSATLADMEYMLDEIDYNKLNHEQK